MQLPDKTKKILGFLYILIGALLEFSSNKEDEIINAETDNLAPKGAL